MAEKKRSIDKDLIRELAALLKEVDLAEIEVEQDDFRVRVSRTMSGPAAPAGGGYVASADRPPSAEAAPQTTAPASSDPDKHPGAVPSPMVGTVYLAPEPGARGYVQVGDEVNAGQIILIVEAMKHMNEVVAPRSGTVKSVLVEDGQPVEFGQPLMIIE